MKKIVCSKCGKENVSDANFCEYCGFKLGEAPEIPAQEQPKITFDYGVIETSRFYITTDKSFYESMKENPKFVSMFTPEYLEEFKEGCSHVQDFQIYIFCISQEE